MSVTCRRYSLANLPILITQSQFLLNSMISIVLAIMLPIGMLAGGSPAWIAAGVAAIILFTGFSFTFYAANKVKRRFVQEEKEKLAKLNTLLKDNIDNPNLNDP